MGLGCFFGKPKQHRVATDFAVVIQITRQFFLRWDDDFKTLATTWALNLDGVHGGILAKIPNRFPA